MIVDDYGITIQLTVKDSSGVAIDISSASTKDIILVKPTGVSLTKSGSFVTDGTDGKLKYTTIAGDIDVVGQWRIRAHVVTATYGRLTTYETFLVDN